MLRRRCISWRQSASPRRSSGTTSSRRRSSGRCWHGGPGPRRSSSASWRSERVCCNSGVAPICTLVVCGAPLASRAPDVAAELLRAGWLVRVILTSAGEQWVDGPALQAVVGSPEQTQLRAASSPKPPRSKAIAVVPITFNSVGKVANGIADTLAHSAMAEALGEGLPFVAVSMVNQYLAANPAWAHNTKHLTTAGVTWVSVIDGSAGPPEPVQSGSGPALVDAFDPAWVTGNLPPAATV